MKLKAKINIKNFLPVLFALIFTGNVFAQSNIELFGEISVSIVETNSGYDSLDYSLNVDRTTSYKLIFNTPPEQKITTGQYAHVKGSWVNSTHHEAGILVEELLLSSASTHPVETLSTSRNVIVIAVNFTDTSANCNNTQASNLMWTGTKNIAEWYFEQSFGNITFPSDTDGDSSVDVVNVTISSNMGSTCNYNTWANSADTLAESAGFDLNLYDHRVYILPETAPCDWAGLGNLGCGSYCRSWTLYCNDADILAHELGHNLGLNHAGVDVDNNGSSEDEYGDVSCIMGYGGVGYRHLNASHKADLGWIPESRIQTATTTGSFTLALNELEPSTVSPAPPTSMQILKVGVPDSSDYYIVSYRVDAGDYSGDLSNVYNGKLNIHRTSGDTYSYLISTIGSGEEFDDDNGTAFTNVQTFDNYVTFDLATSGTGGGGSTSYSISGRVTDGGGTIRSDYRSGIRVKLKNTTTRERQRTFLSNNGNYSFDSLSPGTYRVRVVHRPTRTTLGRQTVTVDGSEDVDFNF